MHAERASVPGPTPPNRRDLLNVGVAALAMGVVQLRLSAAAGAREAAGPVVDLCPLPPEQTEGRRCLPSNLLRHVTEGKSRLPLRLRIAVADVNSYTPPAPRRSTTGQGLVLPGRRPTVDYAFIL